RPRALAPGRVRRGGRARRAARLLPAHQPARRLDGIELERDGERRALGLDAPAHELVGADEPLDLGEARRRGAALELARRAQLAPHLLAPHDLVTGREQPPGQALLHLAADLRRGVPRHAHVEDRDLPPLPPGGRKGQERDAGQSNEAHLGRYYGGARDASRITASSWRGASGPSFAHASRPARSSTNVVGTTATLPNAVFPSTTAGEASVTGQAARAAAARVRTRRAAGSSMISITAAPRAAARPSSV